MKKVFIVIMSLMFIVYLAGCKNNDCKYNFHFGVEGGNGEIKIQTSSSFNPNVYLCKEMEEMCKLNCPDETYFVSLLGEKNGVRELTLIAIPNEGYKVKEWIFNGETVVGNDSLIFTAKVDGKLEYNGVIVVRFEKITTADEYNKISSSFKYDDNSMSEPECPLSIDYISYIKGDKIVIEIFYGLDFLVDNYFDENPTDWKIIGYYFNNELECEKQIFSIDLNINSSSGMKIDYIDDMKIYNKSITIELDIMELLNTERGIITFFITNSFENNAEMVEDFIFIRKYEIINDYKFYKAFEIKRSGNQVILNNKIKHKDYIK